MPAAATDWLFRSPQGDTQAIPVNGRLSVTNAHALKQLALGHMGISMVSKWSVWEELETGTVVRLFSDDEVAMSDFNNAVWLVYPSRKYLPLKVRVFIDYLKTTFRQRNPWDKV